MRPDLAPLDERDRRRSTAGSTASLPDVGQEGPTPAQLEAMQSYPDRQGQAIRNLAALYVARPLPVDFRVNVNPFVIWIWIGGAIAVVGGADRGLARARGAPAARLRRLRRAPGPRARPRLGDAAGPSLRRVDT